MTELPQGYSVRPPQRDDLPAAQALLDLCEETDAGDTCLHEMDIAVESQAPQFDMERGAWLVLAPDTTPAGIAWLWSPSEGHGEVTADHYVHPDHRHTTVDEVLVDLIERRAVELAAATPSVGSLILFSGDVYVACGAALLTRGYERVRDFSCMRIDVTPEWRPHAAIPAGFDVRPVDPEVDGTRIYAADEEAFSEHYLFHSRPYEEWRARTFERPDFDPSLWLVAWDGEQVAGMCWAIVREGETYIDDLAVRKPWRGRGLALGLLQAVFALLMARGIMRIRLYVDDQNVTGALRVYERAGMRVERHFGAYEKKLR